MDAVHLSMSDDVEDESVPIVVGSFTSGHVPVDGPDSAAALAPKRRRVYKTAHCEEDGPNVIIGVCGSSTAARELEYSTAPEVELSLLRVRIDDMDLPAIGDDCGAGSSILGFIVVP